MRTQKANMSQKGFSLIEVTIAVLILAIGVLSLIYGFMVGLVQLSSVQPDLIAKEKAAEAAESVFAARDTRVLQWAQIRNVAGGGGADGGVFLDGPQNMYTICTSAPANDGLVNTPDDQLCAMESIVTPGPDNLLVTQDDLVVPLDFMTREIEIRDVQGDPNLRQIRIIMRYRVGRITRDYTLTTFISSFA